MSHRPAKRIALFSLLILSILTLAFAAKDKSVMHIEADSSTYDYKTGLNIFEGHVKVTQGKTHLIADRVTTRQNKAHQITEAIAYGIKNRAKYWTQLRTGERPVYAQANVMRYYPNKGSMTLQQDVEITQGKNSFQGELIVYNINKESVHVPAANNARSVLVYHPNEK